MVEPKKVVRSGRKTIALVIDSNGELIIRAPYYASEYDIMGFVAQKQDWILEKSLEMQQRQASRPVLTLADGETISYRGRECVIHRGFVKKVYFDGESFLLPDTEDAKDKLVAWYRKEAGSVLRERVDKLSEAMGVEPCGVRITSARTRWGSCSYRNHLNFSWRLLMCPDSVIDYVVVHELCHIYHKDHSRSFWKSVSKADKAYKEHEKWLKANERLMEVI